VPPTHYEILGVSEHATDEEIEAAFKSKASEVHPDRVSPANPYLKNIAAKAFKNLSEAKAVLVDAGRRQKYDAELASSRGSSASPSPGGAANPYRKSPGAAPAADPTLRVPRHFLWLVNAPSGLFCAGSRVRSNTLGWRDHIVPRQAYSSSWSDSRSNDSRGEFAGEPVLSVEKGIARHGQRAP